MSDAGWLKRLYRVHPRRRIERRSAADRPRGQLSGRHIELAALGARRPPVPPCPAAGLLAAAAPVGDFPGARRHRRGRAGYGRDPEPDARADPAPACSQPACQRAAAAVLLGFAALLSWRIRRLRDAAGRRRRSR
jgi:two-component system, OmpR family, sensor histidine kinase ChvG